jgi:hypothetical protein
MKKLSRLVFASFLELASVTRMAGLLVRTD